MIKRTFLFLCSFLFISLSGWPSDIRVVIDTGHTGKVTALELNERHQFLFSGGEDGSVRAWNSDTNRLVSQLQVSQNPILTLAMHPKKTHFAALFKSGLNSYELAAWDWRNKKKLYSVFLDDMPTRIAFSPEGSYLVYSQLQWRGITFLDASTGRKLPYLSDGFGLVAGFVVSPSENTVMTYNPSGRIEYWRVREETRSTRLETEADLTRLHFTGNLRFMVGTKGERLYLIDLLTGKAAASLQMGTIHAVTTNPLTNEIAGIHRIKDRLHISVINYINGRLLPRGIARAEDAEPTTAAFFFNTIYFPGQEGNIHHYSITPEAPENQITGNTLAPINDIAFRGTGMFFTTKEKIGFIDSDFFSSSSSVQPRSMSMTLADHPYSESLFVESAADGRTILWDAESGQITLPGNKEAGADDTVLELGAPLHSVRVVRDRLVVITVSGLCRIYSLPDLNQIFSFNAFGIKTATPVEDRVIIGKSGSSGLDASLLLVDMKTKETLPVSGTGIMVFDTLYDPGKKKVYTLGIEEGDKGIETVCRAYYGKNFGVSSVIFRYPGEDMTAHMVLNPKDSTLYTSLGFDEIRGFSTSRKTELGEREHIPRRLFIHRQKLFSLNSDHSISVWELGTRKKVMDFYFFEDGNWVALLSSGRFYASEGADKFLAFYDDIDPVSDFEIKNLRQN